MPKMTTNKERAADLIYAHMSSWDDEIQAVSAAQDLADADLLMPDDLIAEKKAHTELREWVARLHSRVYLAGGGGAVTFHKANFLDEITRVLEGDDD